MNTPPTHAPLSDHHLWPILGICPLVYAADSLVTGLGLGFICFISMVTTLFLAWILPGRAVSFSRPATVLLLLAFSVTLATLLLRAYLYELHVALALVLPILITNASVLGEADILAGSPRVERGDLRRRLIPGIACFLALAAAGFIREFPGAYLVDIAGFHLAEAPATGFLVMAAFFVAGNAFSRRNTRP